MALPPRQLPSGLVTKNLRPVLETAGTADATRAFRGFITSLGNVYSSRIGPQLAVLARG
jgi:hypothetical protein